MGHESATTPVTIRAAKDVMREIDAIASATDRSRNYIINQAIEQYLEVNSWQLERIRAGIEDVHAGRVDAAEDAFAAIAKRHGWTL